MKHYDNVVAGLAVWFDISLVAMHTWAAALPTSLGLAVALSGGASPYEPWWLSALAAVLLLWGVLMVLRTEELSRKQRQ